MFMSAARRGCMTLAPGQIAFDSVQRNSVSALPSSRLPASVAGVATPAIGMGQRSTGQCRPTTCMMMLPSRSPSTSGVVVLISAHVPGASSRLVRAGGGHRQIERRARVVDVARRHQAEMARDGKDEAERVGDVDLGRHVARRILDGDRELGAGKGVGDAAEVDDVLAAGRPKLVRPVVEDLRHLHPDTRACRPSGMVNRRPPGCARS